MKDVQKTADTSAKEINELGKKSKRSFNEANDASNKFKKTIDNIGTRIVAAFAIERITSFTSEAVQLAGELEGVQAGFNRLNNPRLLDDLRSATKGTVSDLDLMKQAVQANNFEIPLNQLGSLFEFARRRAKETGESVEFLTQSIVTGIGRKSPLILDNLGISAVALKDKMDGVSIASASVGEVAEVVGEIASENLQKMG